MFAGMFASMGGMGGPSGMGGPGGMFGDLDDEDIEEFFMEMGMGGGKGAGGMPGMGGRGMPPDMMGGMGVPPGMGGFFAMDGEDLGSEEEEEIMEEFMMAHCEQVLFPAELTPTQC